MMGATSTKRQRKRAVQPNAIAAPPSFDAVDDPEDPYYFSVDKPLRPHQPISTAHPIASPAKRQRATSKPVTTSEAPTAPASVPTTSTPKQKAAPTQPAANSSPPNRPVRSPTRPAVQLPPPAVRTAKPAPPPSQGGLINPAAARTLFRSSSGGGAALAVIPPPASTTISEVSMGVFGFTAGCTPSRQAQERGEQLQLLDDAVYALDGMSSSMPASARRDSALQLLRLCVGRRGIPSLRTEGLLMEVLRAFVRYVTDSRSAGADTARHARHCAAALLLCLARPTAHHEALTEPPALDSLALLLECTPTDSRGAEDVTALLQGVPCARELPPDQLQAPVSLMLWGLAGACEPERHGHAALRYRDALQARGSLMQVALLHAALVQHLTALPNDEGVQWQCLQSCRVLVHATSISDGGDVDATGSLITLDCGQHGCFTRVLVVYLQCLHAMPPTRVLQASTHACLSLLMNLMHGNAAAVASFVHAGGMQCALDLLADFAAVCMQAPAAPAGTPASNGATGTTNNETSKSDCLGVCLGLLINVLEQDASLCGTLLELVPSPQRAAAPGRAVQLLCALHGHVAGAASTEAEDVATPLSQPGELTLDTLASLESSGQASFLLVYLCILLGFLAVSSKAAAAEVIAGLPGERVDVLVGPVEQCLQFYASMGAMAADSQHNLQQLISDLQRCN